MTDAQLAHLSLGDVELRVNEANTERYIGFKKVEGGLPFGAARDENGQISLKQVAVIRIKPKEHILFARKLLQAAFKRSLWISAAVGFASALVILGISSLFTRPLPAVVMPPCQVLDLQPQSVLCVFGDRSIVVRENTRFPGGHYQLNQVHPEQRQFSATALTSRPETIVFQIVPPPTFSTNRR